MSNQFYGATVAVEGGQVHYDVSARQKGSVFGRSGEVSRSYRVNFHPDNLFRGVHDKIALDASGRSGITGDQQDEILNKQLLNHAGGMTSWYDDLAYMVAPLSSQSGPIILQLARYDDIYLAESFPNGGDGMLFEFEGIGTPNGTVDGNPESLKIGSNFIYLNQDIADLGNSKEDYRWRFEIKNNRDRDDYSRIIEMAKAFSLTGPALESAVFEIMDIDQQMRSFAMMSLQGVFDVYSVLSTQNISFYVRPDDNKVMMFPWDWDQSWWNPTNAPLHGSAHANITKIFNIPSVERLHLKHLNDLIDSTFNVGYMAQWTSHFGSLVGQNYSGNLNYIQNRGNFVLSQLPTQIPFAISGSSSIDVGAATSASIEGTGWINVHEIRLTGQTEPLDLVWSVGAGASYAQSWQTDIALQFGTNAYTFEAYDFQGNLIGSESILITTSAGNPVIDSLRITEINYNPGQPTAAEQIANPNLGNNDFEFLQVENIGAQTISLQGVSFASGVTFDFPNSNLTPGQRGIIVKDQSAFELRYGSGLNVLGQFITGSLSNQGEGLSLAVGGQTFLDFSYGDNDPWSEGADGAGQSLVLIDPSGTPTQDYGDFERWRGSTEWGGSPGTAPMDPVGVVINEVFSNSDLSQVDAIELHNPTGSAIDISGWWLSDNADNLFKYQIPATTMIPAVGYVVFDESHFNPTPLSPAPNHFALNSTNGDQVWLIDPNAGGTEPEYFVDNVVFPAAISGETLGRWPDSSGRLDPMTTSTIGSANSGPRVGPLVISEVMYNPPDPGGGVDPSQLEYVEIYNPTAQTVDLADWELNGTGWNFAAGASIGPGQTLVVVPFDPVTDTTAIANFESAYNVSIATGSAPYVGPYAGGLDGGGERLRLPRAADPPQGTTTIPLVIEDRVDYNDTAPWPTSPDGSGDSLHRDLSDLWAGDTASWSAGLPSPGRFGPIVTTAFSPATQTIGEAGQLNGLTHVVQTVVLTQSYTNPVVFAQPASIAGNDAVVVRISNVQANQFDIQLVEPSDLNGTHGIAESVGYMVFEAGSHLLADGTQLEVGTVSTDDTVGNLIPSPSWETVNFASAFDVTPVVVSQVQTLGVGSEGYLSTRQNTTSTTSFDVALQQEELIATPHSTETIGYLAMDPGAGTWNSLAYDAQTTAAQFTETFSPLLFSQSFSTLPSFVGAISTFNGSDNSHLRYQTLSTVAIDLKIEEDTTRDTEILHSAAESVSYLAIGGQGTLTSVLASIGDGQAETFAIHVTEAGTVNDVRVTLDVTHSRLEDLDIFLEAPDGTMVELFTDVGGDGDNLTGTTLTDGASQSITLGSAPFSGRFQPEGLLRTLQGKAAAGTWMLHVTDDTVNGDVGVIGGASLDIELAPAVAGNVNHDSELGADDIDLLFANLGSADPTFDLDHDGDSDNTDVDELVLNILGKRYGDGDLDQDVDFTDLRRLVTHYDPLGSQGFSGWRRGDFDSDTDVDMDDFNQVATNHAPFGYPAGNLESPDAANFDAAASSGQSLFPVDTQQTVPTKTDVVRANASDGNQPPKVPERRAARLSTINDSDRGTIAAIDTNEFLTVRLKRLARGRREQAARSIPHS